MSWRDAMQKSLGNTIKAFSSDDSTGPALTRIRYVDGTENPRTGETEGGTRESVDVHAQVTQHTRRLDSPPFVERVDGMFNFLSPVDEPELVLGDLVDYQGERYEVMEARPAQVTPGRNFGTRGRMRRVERDG